MNTISSLNLVFTLALLLGVAAFVGLIAGINLTLTTRRKAGLRLISICGAVLVAVGISIVLLVVNQ